ncbi:MAG: PaaI family thioesterase [Runella slithyformis]|nr:MAG: PaaI family thioesterase [Runella slithyformis]TAF96615.1 MAG: PaaI family thioesterase [Runella sp.]TAG19962.1 MAG: PaaI family thioesterase [Cytophagales bacterium]TAG40105.1 MAG: PaaI family thioesterase [Cytophagia bacterium]TAF78908.1 MAG: PaaI family thioesterase [Runella slithyformis]
MESNIESNPRLDFFRSQIGSSLSQSLSPMGRWLDGKLTAVTNHSMTVEMLVREEMSNPMGTLHGGAAAAIMDDTVGAMVFALGREFAYTSVNLNCDFLNVARIGDLLSVQAQVIRAGKNVIHCECRILHQDGKIVAKCSTNMIQTGVKLPF